MYKFLILSSLFIISSCKPQSELSGYKILHKTEYTYSKSVSVSDQIIRLHSFDVDERIVSCHLLTDSINYAISDTVDRYNQKIWVLHFNTDINHLKITTRLVLDTTKFFSNEYKYSLSHYKDSAHSFLQLDSFNKEMTAFLNKNPLNGSANEQELLKACNNVFQEIEYSVHEEPGIYSTDELLKRGTGSCRDMTWFLVQYLRAQHIKARVVSGYLIDWDTKTAEFHSWAEAKSREGTWVGLDPTSGLFVTAFHIPLCVGENYSEIAPLEGFTEPCEVKLDFEIKMTKQ